MQISSRAKGSSELPLGSAPREGSQHIGLESRSRARRLAVQPKHRCPWECAWGGVGGGVSHQPLHVCPRSHPAAAMWPRDLAESWPSVPPPWPGRSCAAWELK